MNWMALIGIGQAHAAATSAAGGPSQGGLMSMLPMLVVFFAAAYFLIIRPQSKRNKAQKALMEKLTAGDEIVTIGGMVATLKAIRGKYVELELSEGNVVTAQKTAIATVLPKGSMEAAEQAE